MRTTVSLPDDLVREAKIRAARDDRSMSSLMEEALRTFFASADASGRAQRADFAWPTFGGGGAPFVDVDDNSATLDTMDAP